MGFLYVGINHWRSLSLVHTANRFRWVRMAADDRGSAWDVKSLIRLKRERKWHGAKEPILRKTDYEKGEEADSPGVRNVVTSSENPRKRS